MEATFYVVGMYQYSYGISNRNEEKTMTIKVALEYPIEMRRKTMTIKVALEYSIEMRRKTMTIKVALEYSIEMRRKQ